MVTKKEQGGDGGPPSRRRGRPPGRTAAGEATRKALFDAAIELMDERGYDGTTLRDVAARAGVGHPVLYRYFPSKSALLAALYDRLSADFERGTTLEPGSWRRRARTALDGSLASLRPHRSALRSALGVLVSTSEMGLFGEGTRASRARVQGVFLDAVAGARDAPRGARAPALGRLVDLAHLGVVLFWLLDGSREQRATEALLAAIDRALPLVSAALKIPGAWALLERVDRAVVDGLGPEPAQA
ncbi:MAG: TetR/AcrR family transcriptional regulator [Planctomycetota bacterium]